MAPVTQRAAARALLAAAAVGAGAIHLAVAPAHLVQYAPMGVAFVAAGVVQLAWGAGIVLRDVPRWLLAGGVLSLMFVGVYLLSRSVGLPVGPSSFQPETFGLADLVCGGLELAAGVAAIALARRPRALRGRVGRRWTVALVAGFVLVGSASTTALAASQRVEHRHGDGRVHACPSQPVRSGVVDERGVDTGVTVYFRCLLEHQHDHAPA